jgi:glycosyltransferase involved in cell wall biosynthesis
MDTINILLLRSGVKDASVLLGAERIILSLAKGMDRKKFKIIIAVLSNNADEDIPLMKYADAYNIKAELIKLKCAFDFRAIFAVKKLIAKYKINILHSQEYKSNIISFFVAKLNKVVLLSTIHGWTRAGVKVKLYEFADSIILNFFNKVIAVSESIKKEALRKRIPQKKIVVIENAVDDAYLNLDADPSLLRKKFNIGENLHVIGTMGRLSAEKGHKYFIQAASKVLKKRKDVIFIIMGEGNLRSKLEAYIEKLKMWEHVKIINYRENISEFLSLLDIYVSPSLRESFNLSLTEAMLFGRPVISTNVGVAPDVIIDNKTGILIKAKDSESLALEIIKLLEDKQLRKQMARSSSKVVLNKFSLATMVAKYEKIYMKCIKGQQ